MHGSGDCHAKWSKSERERQIPYDTTYVWDLKNYRHEDKTKGKIMCQCPNTKGDFGNQWI